MVYHHFPNGNDYKMDPDCNSYIQSDQGYSHDYTHLKTSSCIKKEPSFTREKSIAGEMTPVSPFINPLAVAISQPKRSPSYVRHRGPRRMRTSLPKPPIPWRMEKSARRLCRRRHRNGGKIPALKAYPLVNVYSLQTGKWPSRTSGFTHE